MLRTGKLSEALASRTAAISARQSPDGADGLDSSSAQWIEGVGKGVIAAAEGYKVDVAEAGARLVGTEPMGKFGDGEIGGDIVGEGGGVQARRASSKAVRQAVRVAVRAISRTSIAERLTNATHI